jgi:catechol 2,3-dioxygenase-like lactoylglutathione lyase family enzyme
VLVPELSVANPETAATALTAFGFAPQAGLWCLGSQAVRLVQGQPQGHGRIDHVALGVPDMDAALDRLVGRGIALDAGVTPNGPELIPEFWEDGLRFVYLSGPESARIELCQRITGAASAIGQDHVGIPCDDLATVQAFFLGQGATPIAAVDLIRPEGMIPVRFLAFHGGVIELYQPAEARAVAGQGLWSRLLVDGLATVVHGPEGLTLAPL